MDTNFLKSLTILCCLFISLLPVLVYMAVFEQGICFYH